MPSTYQKKEKLAAQLEALCEEMSDSFGHVHYDDLMPHWLKTYNKEEFKTAFTYLLSREKVGKPSKEHFEYYG